MYWGMSSQGQCLPWMNCIVIMASIEKMGYEPRGNSRHFSIENCPYAVLFGYNTAIFFGIPQHPLAYLKGEMRGVFCLKFDIDGFVQDCSNSIANALELLQSCVKPSICSTFITVVLYNILIFQVPPHMACIHRNSKPDQLQYLVLL